MPEARVVHRYPAAADAVYDAWLDPGALGRWMFGPEVRDEAVVALRADAEVGGTFSFVVRREAGEIDHIGTYLVLDRPRHLAFTWGTAQDAPASSRVDVRIEVTSDGCEVTLTQGLDPGWADFVPQAEAAWDHMLDTLAHYLADPGPGR